jgi:hypothetical protein
MQLIFLVYCTIPDSTFIEIISQLFSIIEAEFIVYITDTNFAM